MAKKTSPLYEEENNSDESIINDIGKYIEPVVRQWQWIAACALGFGILVFCFSRFIMQYSPSYKAIALVASAQTESSVDFGSEIKTISDVQLAAQFYDATIYDRNTRLQSFIAQVHNAAIAEKVLDEVGPILNNNGDPFTATDLADLVSADLLPKTDTIAISVSYNNPAIAAEIVNAWGKGYVEWINELYSLYGTNSFSTEADITQAQTNYEKTESALEDYIAHDKTNEYKRQVEEISEIITQFRNGRSIIGSQQVNDHLIQLDQVYNEKRQIGLFLANAVSMRAAVNVGGESAAISNSLALTMLKTQIYSAFEGSNTLQVQNLPEALGSNISTITSTGMVEDLDALISTLEKRQTELSKLIDTLSFDVENEKYLMNFSNTDTPIETKIIENEQKVRDLNSLIAAEESTLQELTQLRDLSWKSYSALATKAVEMSVKGQDIQLVFASSATPPNNPSAPFSKALASGVGLLIGILTAYAYEFWQIYKGRKPEIITQKIIVFLKSLVNRRQFKSRDA
jgi:capsular polysaccharide biosynthesis protein